jgi:hypothetical protein
MVAEACRRSDEFIDPQALRETDARDAERQAGDLHGPLHRATPMVNSAGSPDSDVKKKAGQRLSKSG